MNSSGLWHDIKSNPLALIVAVGLHVAIIVMLSMNLMSSEVHVAKRVAQKTIKAVLIDTSKMELEAKKLKLAENKKQKKALVDKKRDDKKRREAEQKKKKQAEVKKKKAVQKKKAADRKKAADIKKAEQKKQAKLKKQAEQKKKQTAEKKRKQEQARQAELKRKQEARKKEQARQQKLAEEAERKRAEQELKRKLAEEERLEREAVAAAARERRLDTLRAQYVRMIEQKVERNWLKPVGSSTASSCEVYVTQSILGDVLDVRLSSCQNDAAYKRSIERAVRRASPLPPPPDPGVFDKQIQFVFRPQN